MEKNHSTTRNVNQGTGRQCRGDIPEKRTKDKALKDRRENVSIRVRKQTEQTGKTADPRTDTGTLGNRSLESPDALFTSQVSDGPEWDVQTWHLLRHPGHYHTTLSLRFLICKWEVCATEKVQFHSEIKTGISLHALHDTVSCCWQHN